MNDFDEARTLQLPFSKHGRVYLPLHLLVFSLSVVGGILPMLANGGAV
jgi:hypothetical protein